MENMDLAREIESIGAKLRQYPWMDFRIAEYSSTREDTR